MKKKLTISFFLIVTCLQSQAQTVVITDDNSVTTGDASSVLDLVSTSKGFLAPRMTETQRTTIANPAAGLLVYQTNNDAGYYYFDGTEWLVIAKGTGWTANGDDIFYSDGKVGIGTNTPGATLNVMSTTPTSGFVALGLFEGTSNTGSSNAVTFQLRNNSASNAKTFFTFGGNTSAKQWMIGNDLLGANQQNFYLYDQANSATRLFVDASGNIGLGNNHTTPTEVLDVSGNIKFSGALMPDNDAGTDSYLLTSAGTGNPPVWADPNIYFETYAWKPGGNTFTGLKNLGTVSNHDVPFITNNTEKMRLTASGRLGIGLTAPDAPLHIKATTPTSGITPIAVFEETRDAGLSNGVVMYLGNRSATSSATRFVMGSRVSSKNWILGTDKDGDNSSNFYLWDSDGVKPRFFVDGINGYTGLGTSSPLALLHVLSHLDASQDVPTALFEGISDGGVVSLSLINNSGARAKTAFRLGGSTSTYQWSLGSDVQGNNEHNFYIYDEASFNTRFFINSDGEIGIGNITPTEALDITGNLKFSGAIMPDNNAGTAGYMLTSAGANSAPVWIDPEATLWKLDGNTLTGLKNFGTTSNHDIPFITNNTEKMRLTADGELGIGISVPAAPFHVKIVTPTTGLIPVGLFEGTANNGSGNAVYLQLRNNSASSSKTFINMGGPASSNQWLLGTDISGTNSQNFYLFDFASFNTPFFVDANGRIGLGNNLAPTEVLDVTGNARFSGSITGGTWNGTEISPVKGGTGFTSWSLGEMLYANGTNTLAKVSGNTSTQKMFLSQTGTGSASAAPEWAALTTGDITNIIKTSITISNTSNVTPSNPLEVNVTVTGAQPNASVIVNPRADLTTRLGIAYSYVSAVNTVRIVFNCTNGTIQLGSNKDFDITVINNP